MRCTSCGHENPQGSIFCQQCGARSQQGSATVTCSRCQSQQPINLRFCTTCGNTLSGPPAPAPAPAPVAPQALGQPAPVAPQGFGQQAPSGFGQPQAVAPQAFGQPAPAPQQPAFAAPQPVYAAPVAGSPLAMAGVDLAERQGAAAGAAPVCWRCRGAGEAGHEFCKFCGARYVDAPLAGAPAVASSVLQAPAPQPAAPQVGSFSTAIMSAVPASTTAPARLVSILKDGTDGQTFAVQQEAIDIGRLEGEVVLADDPYLSPRHARVRRQGDQYFVRDLDSVNGVYVRLRDSIEIVHGDFVLVGQQVLRLEVLDDVESPFGPAGVHGVLVFGTPETPRAARLMQYTTEGLVRDVFYLYRNETVVGRENGDIVFTDDPFLSRRHAAVRFDRAQKKFSIADVGSSNGTFVRIRGERALAHNDQFRVGRHLFRFEIASAMQGAR